MRLKQSVMVTVASVGTVIGAGIGLASPALAAPLEGLYTSTVTDGGGVVSVGAATQKVITPCGPTCIHMERVGVPGTGSDLYQQGTDWVSARDEQTGNVDTINEVTLQGSSCSLFGCVRYVLVKNG